jgi:hypothetical protein
MILQYGKVAKYTDDITDIRFIILVMIEPKGPPHVTTSGSNDRFKRYLGTYDFKDNHQINCINLHRFNMRMEYEPL